MCKCVCVSVCHLWSVVEQKLAVEIGQLSLCFE